MEIIIIIIIIIIKSLFKEDNIFSVSTNLTYGPHKTLYDFVNIVCVLPW